MKMTRAKAVDAQSAFYGVDVCSEFLDVAQHGSERVTRLPNTPAAIRTWVSSLSAGSTVAMESTGRYHEALAHAAHARGLTVHVLDPRAVRKYAQGVGTRGKTDRLDAQVIARLTEREHAKLRAWQPLAPEQAALQELLRHRAALVKHKTALRQAASHSAQLQATDAPVLEAFDRALAEMDRQIKQTVQTMPQGAQALAHITSVPGLGLLTGSALLVLFQRLAHRGGDAVIAFTGLDPRPMESGQKRGVRRLSKQGPAEVRRLLYTAAMSAARTPTWRAYYEAQRAKGLSTTAALIVLARKLVRVAFSLFKAQAVFDPNRVKTAVGG